MSDSLKDDNKDVSDNPSSKYGIFDNFVSISSNNHITFVVRKSERLASALYVITGFMPPEEPARTRLRVCALEIITRSANPHELLEGGAERFESRCSEIVTILRTAHYSGLISEMNANLLGEEYTALALFVRENTEKIAERGSVLRKSTISEPRSVSGSLRQSDKNLLISGSKNKRTKKSVSESPLGSRKDLILSVFKTRYAISIKDVTSLMPQVSEKTVQRDILDLVGKGVLIKTGSRRWTTYRKAQDQGSESGI